MANRWWIYQRERFPLFKNGLLIAAFSMAAVSHSLLLRDRLGTQSLWQAPGPMVIAFVSLFLFFLQLRIADEFKDFREDSRYRPDRPVPRGLVQLWELGIVAIAAAMIQLGLALVMGVPMVLLLVGIWAYLGLMTREFFLSRWLKAHPIAYLLSHAVIMPLLAFYATAWDWLVAKAAPPSGLVGFLGVSVLSGLAIEVGRKIRAPRQEELGVETYSALWGWQRAALVWLGLVWLLTLAALMAAWQIQFVAPVAFVLLFLITASVILVWQFLYRPTTTSGSGFEVMAAVWTLLVYLSIGIIPQALREFGYWS